MYEQDKTISQVLRSKELNDKAYVIIFDLLDEQESTKAYEVRYNDRSRVALDYKRWTINDPSTETEIRKKVYEFLHTIIDQLFHELCEDNIIVKRMTIMTDGTLCD